MKLNQLLYFCRSCEVGNISRAAVDLHISQSTISVAIHELEEDFGVLLMQRNNKGFKLTREGQYFYEKATAILSQTNHLEQVMLDIGGKRKQIEIGVPPMIGTFLFPDLYKEFTTKYPDIILSPHEGGTEELLKLLDDNKLDFAIATVNDISNIQYRILPLTKTETVFCIHSNHPLAKHTQIAIKDIKDEPLIMFRDGYSQSRLVEERFSQEGYHPYIIYRSEQLYTIKEFISRGIAAGFLFHELADAIPGITGIPFIKPLHVQIGLIWKPNQHHYKAATAFLRYIRMHFQK